MRQKYKLIEALSVECVFCVATTRFYAKAYQKICVTYYILLFANVFYVLLAYVLCLWHFFCSKLRT